METTNFIKETQQYLDTEILASLESSNGTVPERLKASMAYSLDTGGKRIRPMLLLATLKALGEDIEKGLKSAIALEYIHTYSLIHDDLPAMDNDDYRRGQLTNHKAFDEATAILAGDALLTNAFAIIANDSKIADSNTKIKLIANLSKAAGSTGMIAGQVNDVNSEGKSISLQELQNIHKEKTGELLHSAIYSAVLLANASTEITNLLDEYAWTFGIAYQIQNDLQEVMWTDEKRGKLQHSDADLTKNTYPSILGTNEALEALFESINQCRDILKQVKQLDEHFDEELLVGFLAFLKI